MPKDQYIEEKIKDFNKHLSYAVLLIDKFEKASAYDFGVKVKK